MDSKNKKTLLAGFLIVSLLGVSVFVVHKAIRHGSYEFETVAHGPGDHAIPVAPGPATPGPETLPPTDEQVSEQNQNGIPVVAANGQTPGATSTQGAAGVNGGADRRLAAVAPGAGIAAGPHGGGPGTSQGSPDAGVPVIVDKPAVVSGTDTGASAKVEKEETAKAPEPTCFTFTYKHKPTAGHDSEEACSHHRNLIHLAHKDVNPSSLCMRVNGKPVAFTAAQGKPDEILIGAVAGPHATITASYCTGKVKCAQSCKVPKDEFLEAIGGAGGESEGDGLAMGQWQQQEGDQDHAQERAKNSKLVADMKRELAAVNTAEGGQDGASDGYTLFQGWIADAGSPSCGDQTTAHGEGSGTRLAGLSARAKKGE